MSDDEKYEEIIGRLDRIENFLKPLENDTSYGKKILSNILGNMIWQWFEFEGRGLFNPLFPPKNNK